jgi:alkane 1-monooxygenase
MEIARMSDTVHGRSLETDRQAKRWLWLISVAGPSVPAICSIGFFLSGNPLWALAAPLFYYGLVPLLDAVFGEDHYNPPAKALDELSDDQWYRFLLFLSVPVIWTSLVLSAIAAATPGIPLWAFLGFSLSAAIVSGGAITVGHELGHKPNRLDQFGAKIANAASGYAHFCIEHNRGHHVLVATPADPASSRFGESVWRFALREIPGALVRGLELERERLERKGLPFWSWQNDILQGYAITLAVTMILVAWLGWIMFPFMAINCAVGWLHLTFANYVEHYGLLRERRADGRYQPCEPRHSWNTNHIVSNLMLFHLQRHSDHHANPLRPYQSLRNFHDLPSLPSGYPGSFLLAAIPPLWFRVMNPKVLAWAGGEMSKVNRG